jgi:hypothetical protein
MTLLFSKKDAEIAELNIAASGRDIPLEQIQQWIAEDEKETEAFWSKEISKIRKISRKKSELGHVIN